MADAVCVILPISILGIVGRLMICAIGVNLMYIMIWGRTKDFKYFWNMLKEKSMAIIRR